MWNRLTITWKYSHSSRLWGMNMKWLCVSNFTVVSLGEDLVKLWLTYWQHLKEILKTKQVLHLFYLGFFSQHFLQYRNFHSCVREWRLIVQTGSSDVNLCRKFWCNVSQIYGTQKYYGKPQRAFYFPFKEHHTLPKYGGLFYAEDLEGLCKGCRFSYFFYTDMHVALTFLKKIMY